MKKITLLLFITIIATAVNAQVAAPVFSVKGGVYTKVEGLYFTSETPDAKIMYNKLGKDPKVEGSRLYGSMKETVLSSATINAVAYITNADGETIYSDVTSEYYEISPIALFRHTDEITDTCYMLNCGDNIASPLLANKEQGDLEAVGITKISDKYIETNKFYGLRFTAVAGGYTIQDKYGRYMHLGDGSEFCFSADKPAEGAVWTIAINGTAAITNLHNGKTIAYNADSNTFGAYSDSELNGSHTLPTLFMGIEYPAITITPESDTELSEFAKFTVTCEEGIIYKETNKLYAYYNVGTDSKKREFDNIEEIDENTIEFTLDEPLLDTNEYKVVFPAGVFTLAPDGLANKNKEVIARYTVKNSTILDVVYANPDNSATAKDLQYLYFEFNQEIDTDITGASIKDKSGKTFPLTVSENDAWGAACAPYALCLMTEAPLEPGEYTFVLAREYVSAKDNTDARLDKDITYKFIVTEALKVKSTTPDENTEPESVSEIQIVFNKPVLHSGFQELVVTGADGKQYLFTKETEDEEASALKFVIQGNPLSAPMTYTFTIYGYDVYREDETGMDGMEHITESTHTFTIKGTSGIEEVADGADKTKTVYDLTGRRIETITKSGIYIVDGRKVIIK